MPELIDDLTPQQYEDIYEENVLPVMDIRKSSLRLFSYFLFFIFLALIFLFVYIKIPRQLTFDGVLKSSSPEFIYKFNDNISITRKYIKTAQTVKKGDPLLEIKSNDIANQLMAYQTDKNKYDVFINQEIPLFQEKKKSLLLEKEKLDIKIRETGQKKKYKETFYNEDVKQNYLKTFRNSSEIEKLMQEKANLTRMKNSHLEKLKHEANRTADLFKANRELLEKGIIPESEVKKFEADKIDSDYQLKSAVETYSSQITELDKQIGGLGVEVNLLKNDRQKLEADKDNFELDSLMAQDQNQEEIIRNETEKLDLEQKAEKVSLEDKLNEGYKNLVRKFGDFSESENGIIIKAPFDATISYIYQEEAEVKPNISLIKLIRQPYKLYAYSEVTSDKIGLVKKGDKVAVKIDTFPHYQWGKLEGKISYLSLTNNEKGVYPFEVEITGYGNLKQHLQAGMTGKVSVLADEKSLFQNLFLKLKKLASIGED
jgi:multidrug efflux pump subunit AcrA (membrane-fusion protein)